MIGAFAIDSGNNRHIPGTLVQVFPDNWKFQGGDMTDYILRKLQTNFSIDELQVIAYKKKLAILPNVLTGKLIEREMQSENWRLFSKNKFSPVLKVEDVGIKPNLKDILDADKLWIDTPKAQWISTSLPG